MSQINCLNPWDPQSKRQYGIDGVYATLNAGQAIGGQAHGICYAIEGNTVDRATAKNGKGWCENISPTLNTQDKHAVCYAEEHRNEKMYYMIENHPMDCRVKIDMSDKCQTLPARMGTGGGNVPLVMFVK